MTDREKTNWFDTFLEVLGWVQIMLSPTLIGLVLGGLYYLYSPDANGKLIGSGIAIAGPVVGAIWATRVKKKHGTIWFMTRLMATPELDNDNESYSKKKDKSTDLNDG